MDFLALDFETATAQPDSPCELGIAVVRGGVVHQIWEEVAKLLQDQVIVAHNAAFDMTVLRSTLASLNLDHPTFQYFCSVSMSRKVWPGRNSYGLRPMCDMHGIQFKHHRAGNDAEATAELVLRATDLRPSFDITQFLIDSKVKLGAFYPEGHRTPSGKVVPAQRY